MHKTIYIDIDEEITSVIDRIRKEGAPDIFLVVPKSAMLCQGILNLKLLKKEAHRLGKNILMVTNDKHAKKVIERAGLTLSTKPVVDEDERESRHRPLVEDRVSQEISDAILDERPISKEQLLEEANEIGSSNFFDQEKHLLNVGSPAGNQHQPAEIYKNQRSNNLKAPYSTASASVPKKFLPATKTVPSMDVRHKHAPMSVNQKEKKLNVPSYPDSMVNSRADITIKEEEITKQQHRNSLRGIPTNTPIKSKTPKIWNSKEAKEFFSDYSHKLQQESFSEPVETAKPKPKKKKSFPFGKLLAVVAALAAFSAAAGWVYWTYPYATIIIKPNAKTTDFNIDVQVSLNQPFTDTEKAIIPGKLELIEINKSVDYESTGEKYASDSGKATGRVTIVNNYSANPQPLVATTRLLSKEKRLFRIVDGVTVPGMQNGQPGKVEAEVAADAPGEEFNIGPSTFTIEGFKGTPKYDKFEVTSTSSMSGGGNGADNKKVKVVTAKDIENARQQVADALESDLEKDVQAKISDGNKFLIDTAEKEIAKVTTTRQEGDVADKFSAQVTEKIKIITFPEDDLKKILDQKVEQAKISGYELSSLAAPVYEKAMVSSDKKSLNFTLKTTVTFKPQIDIENIKTGIVGKSEEDMKTFLANYEELSKVEIKFTPAWLHSVPVVERKIRIVVAE